MEQNIKVSWLIIGYALRYALGRQTFAPTDVVEAIITNIDKFSFSELILFCTEIEDAIKNNRAGAECDVQTWQGLINAIEDEIRRRQREKIYN